MLEPMLKRFLGICFVVHLQKGSDKQLPDKITSNT